MWTIFKVFIEFGTILLLFDVSVFWPPGMWDLSSPTRDQNGIPCTGRVDSLPMDCQGSPLLRFI